MQVVRDAIVRIFPIDGRKEGNALDIAAIIAQV